LKTREDSGERIDIDIDLATSWNEERLVVEMRSAQFHGCRRTMVAKVARGGLAQSAREVGGQLVIDALKENGGGDTEDVLDTDRCPDQFKRKVSLIRKKASPAGVWEGLPRGCRPPPGAWQPY